MKSIATGNVMACEHISMGDRGKHILVNVYSGDIKVQDFPATFPMAFYIELLDDGSAERRLSIDVLIGDQAAAKAEIDVDKIMPGSVGLIVLPAIRMEFPNETKLRLVASCKGYRKTEILNKSVSKGIIPY